MNRLNFIVLALIAVAVRSSLAAQKPTSIADKIEPINPQRQQQLQQLQQQGAQESIPSRSPFLDSLFNIPIQTLRAVSELVQGIAGTVQAVTASQRRPIPPRFQQQQQQQQQRQQQRQFELDEKANGIL